MVIVVVVRGSLRRPQGIEKALRWSECILPPPYPLTLPSLSQSWEEKEKGVQLVRLLLLLWLEALLPLLHSFLPQPQPEEGRLRLLRRLIWT